jgi:nitrogenase molybdenum-iron protein NifN
MSFSVIEKTENYTPTTNACKLCTPLGASLVFKGISNAVPLLHGSQGCSTYIRRYVISHFKEPVDIASTNFSEETAIFGGGVNLNLALDNLRKQYNPEMIGIATTCLSETIGDDVAMFLRSYREQRQNEKLPEIIHVSTPSYRGTHMDGFHGAVQAVVEGLSNANSDTVSGHKLNIFPGMVSSADIRLLKDILEAFGISYAMLPDYSDRLDGGLWTEYQTIQKGGTDISEIKNMKKALACIEFGRILEGGRSSAGKYLKNTFDVPCHNLGLPIGVRESDAFFKVLENLSGISTPDRYVSQRERLIDSYVDGHKYVSGIRAVVYGEEDLVVGMVSLLREIGIIPVLCASGGKSGLMEKTIKTIVPEYQSLGMNIRENVDFMDIEEQAGDLSPDILIGNSKGYTLSRHIGKPLVRIGFPVHDRVGGSRIRHLGYEGAQELFDRIVNTLIENGQENSEIGYTYI